MLVKRHWGIYFLMLGSAGVGCQTSEDAASTMHPMNAAALERQPARKAPDFGTANFPAIISNGTVQLGVNPEGHLNAPGGTLSSGASGTTNVGLRFVPTNGEATAPGCLCEGWGVADAATGNSGHASVDTGGVFNVAVESFDTTASEATSVVNVGGRFRVTHRYRPSPATPFLYEVAVTIENISGAPIGDLRYTRSMDWDIAPNTFSEFVTIQGTAGATNVLLANNNGFNNVNPLDFHGDIGFSGDFVDQGPADHGAHFDFGFGSLDAGQSHTFTIFYGAAGDETSALGALGSVQAEVYSFGQANWDGTGDPLDPFGAPTGEHGFTTGQPATFIFAFAGVGGEPVNAPPIANAGPDQSFECVTGPVAVTLDGSASIDPEGAPLGFSWSAGGSPIASGASPVVSLAPGVHSIDLVVNDGALDSAPDSVQISIAADGEAPVLTGCSDITLEGTPGLGGAYVDYAVTGSDSCDGSVAVACDVAAGSFFPIGTSQPVTCTSADSAGNQASCSFLINVVEPTSCDAAAPRSQDYWRTQCNYRAPDGTPPDPTMPADIFQGLLDGVQADLQAVCEPAESTCEALNPDPYWDSCEQACLQYAAVLLNIEAGLSPTSCCTPDGTVAETAAHVAALIAAGECHAAANLAYEFNRGCSFCE